jgi:hypothetical protein
MRNTISEHESDRMGNENYNLWIQKRDQDSATRWERELQLVNKERDQDVAAR